MSKGVKITKPELIDNYVELNEGVTKAEIDRTIKAFVDFMKTSIAVMDEGDSFTIPDFGTFVLNKREARKGRNPRNPEEEIDIAESYNLKYKMAKAIKDQINE